MSASRRLRRLPALGVAFFVTNLWSSSWVLIRFGLDDEAIEPLMFAALRYAVAGLALAGWVMSRPRDRRAVAQIDRHSLARLATLGVVFYAVTQGAQFVAIDNQPAATTSLVLSGTPLLVALFSGAISEAVTARQLIGTAGTVLGAAIYFSGELGSTALGLIAAIVALVANAVSSIHGRSVNRHTHLSASVVTAVAMLVGAVVLGVAALLFEPAPSLTPRAWAIVGWLAVVNTALAFSLWNLSLRTLTALESAAINNTMLVQIAALGWIFLGEQPGPAEITGIVIVSTSIFMIQAAGTSRSFRAGSTRAAGR